MDKIRWKLGVTVAAVLVCVSACSKTVQWEEEVPLNTGVVLWVKRTVVYSSQGGAGNPLDVDERPERDQAIEFTWNDTRYRYQGDARIMLLAISPQNRPVLVAKAPDNSWQARHNYACTYPFYVQLVPDETGRVWTWPAHLDMWLYNSPANLLLSRHPPARMQSRYSSADRQSEDYPGAVNNLSQQKIDPAYTGDLCKRKEK
jgi:hypothetical protein